jgi:trans-aconitate methyltransferase
LCIRNFQSSLQSLISGLDVQRALFVGCGEGIMLARLDLEAFESIHGLDIETASVVAASGTHPIARFSIGDVGLLPFAARSFDLVVCLEVLEHLENPGRAIEELVMVSRRYLVVSVPHEPFFRLGNFVFLRNLRRLGNHPGHVHHWSKSGFRSFLESRGLSGALRTPFPWLLGFFDLASDRR